MITVTGVRLPWPYPISTNRDAACFSRSIDSSAPTSASHPHIGFTTARELCMTTTEPNEQLRARREATTSRSAPGEHLSRQELAELVNAHVAEHTGQAGALDSNYVGKLERGVITWPRRHYRAALRAVLSARTDRELGFTRPGSARPARASSSEPDPGPALQQFDSQLAIARRVHRLTSSNVTPAALVQLRQLIDGAINDYERVGPAQLLADVLPQRRWLDELLAGQQPPGHRLALCDAAARISGLLATMALDLGSTGAARGYAAESFALAELVGDRDLLAWARGTQSLIEYYGGRFVESLEFARDGRRYNPRGPQAIRLAVNGEARALARLGRRSEVDRAVDDGLALLADVPDGGGRMSASLSFGPYCAARVAGNAATAYLWCGNAARAAEFGTRALTTFDALGLTGPRALTRIDLATGLLQDRHPDLERASALVVEALVISPPSRFDAVRVRVGEFLMTAGRWRGEPAVLDVREAMGTGTAPRQGQRRAPRAEIASGAQP
jgi:hypothetical protein